MKRIYSLLLALCATLFSTNAMAEDVKLSKCGGGYSNDGLGANATTISAAVQFSATEMSSYAGGRLTGMRAYLAASGMKTIEFWVKNQTGDARKLASVDLTSKKAGWNEVTFDEPIEITGTEPLALGYTYTQSSVVYPISTADKASTGGLMLSMNNGAFADYSADYGNLSVEGFVSGLTIDNTDVVVSGIAPVSTFYKTNGTGAAAVTLLNTGREIKQVTLRLTCDGKATDTTVSAKMKFGEDATVSASFATPQDFMLGAKVTATVIAIDGAAYESNTASATFDAYPRLYDRTVVIEEGTGTWCPWCVRGFVAMERMMEKYPDSFIGIAAHTSSSTSDPMHISGYANNLGIGGFPGCTVDRVADMKGLSVDPTLFEQYYQIERARGTYADFEFEAYFDENGKIVGESKAIFDFDKDAADIRMAYVLLEDGITGYSQANAYASGTNGKMGGFESKADPTKDVVFNDVARKLYPSFKGTKNSLAADIVKGETYTHTFTYSLPTTPATNKVKDKDNLRLVALMLDGNTGEIINAHQVKLKKAEDAVTGIDATTTSANVYSIDGQRLDAPRRGINIINGKKVVIK